MSVNNGKSEALLSKYGHSAIEAAQPEVKKQGRLWAKDYCGRVVE